MRRNHKKDEKWRILFCCGQVTPSKCPWLINYRPGAIPSCMYVRIAGQACLLLFIRQGASFYTVVFPFREDGIYIQLRFLYLPSWRAFHTTCYIGDCPAWIAHTYIYIHPLYWEGAINHGFSNISPGKVDGWMSLRCNSLYNWYNSRNWMASCQC